MIADWIRVNKKNPCPVCGKPDWCSYTEDGAHLCMRVHLDQHGEFYRHKAGYTSDSHAYSVYRREPRRKKSIRPAQYREWVYYDLDGNKLAKKCRRDYGDGRKKETWQLVYKDGKWVKGGVTLELRPRVAIYRSEEIKKAIAAGERIFIVEGEPAADVLVSLGLQATCSYGGSGFQSSDWTQLEGAQVILCPDTDSRSIKHFDQVAEFFPSAEWLYVYPDSYLWRNLTEGGGLDVYDWVEDRKANAQDILSLIVSHRKDVRFIEAKDTTKGKPTVVDAIRELVIRNITGAKLTAGLREIRKEYDLQVSEAKEIYKDLLAEQEETEVLKDNRLQNKGLISAHDTSLDLEAVFPKELAQAMYVKAETLRVDPNRFVLPLLIACAKMIGAKSSIYIRRDGDGGKGWRQFASFFGADVAEASGKKSSTAEVFFDPIDELQRKETERYNLSLEELEGIKERWKLMGTEEQRAKLNSAENPRIYQKENCTLTTHVIEETTIEALFQRMAEQDEHQGILNKHDELSGFFKGLNQYSKGKGNALQALLSLWNGRNFKSFNRRSLEKSYAATGQTFNLYGGIQPDVIKTVMDAETDPDGLVSRFLVCLARKPKNHNKWCYKTASIHDRLAWLYNKLYKMPVFDCDYTPDAQELFIERYEAIMNAIDAEEGINRGLAAYLGKQSNTLARLSLVVHLIECCYNPDKEMGKINRNTLARAIYLNDFFIGQFKLLQLTNSDRPDRALDKMLMLALKALRKKGSLQVRKFSKTYNKAQYLYEGQRITAQTTRKIFKELEILGYGKLTGDTISIPDGEPPSSPPPNPPQTPPPPPPAPTPAPTAITKPIEEPKILTKTNSVAVLAPPVTAVQKQTEETVKVETTPIVEESSAQWTKEYQGISGLEAVVFDGGLYAVDTAIEEEDYPEELTIRKVGIKDPRIVKASQCQEFRYYDGVTIGNREIS